MSNPLVLIETSLGEILVELFADQAPETVKNFLQYVDDEFYHGVIFHRVIKNFMIQGGGMTFDMKEKRTRAPIKNEASPELPNLAGTLAMARTPDPHSASAQFFINLKDNAFLNHTAPTPQGYGYAVFGRPGRFRLLRVRQGGGRVRERGEDRQGQDPQLPGPRRRARRAGEHHLRGPVRGLETLPGRVARGIAPLKYLRILG
jgi:peptidyl-prolyl cis-trans isomerase B (cyclophilin B)